MTTRKKILFLITKATWGGAQRYVFDLVTHLPKSEFEPVVAYGMAGKLSNKLSGEGMRTVHLSALQRDVAIAGDVRSFVQIWKCIQKERPDIIHVNSSKAAGFGAIAARLLGVPNIVFTAHGWPFKESRGPLARLLIYFVSWFTALISSSVIVVSKTDERIGERMWFLKKKLHYIPIGIDAPAYLSRAEAELALKDKLPKLGEGKRIVTLAELTKNKGLRYAIEALGLLNESHPDLTYTIFGEGEERLALVDATWEHQLEKRVFLPGFVDDAARYLRAFDLFLLPSLKEGMPYVLLEASAAGIPVVATTAVPDLGMLRVPSGSADALADIIEHALGAKEAQHMQPHSSLSDMVQKTLMLYLPTSTEVGR